MNTTHVLLGGNLGNVEKTFTECRNIIAKEIGTIIQQSSLYQSPPWGFRAHTYFLNQVVVVQSALNAEQILQRLLQIESQMGRVRGFEVGYTSRIIDLDILFHNKEVIKTLTLEVPHPRLHLRKFTLFPLAELNSNFIHPIFNKTIAQLLSLCEDESSVEKISNE